MFSNIKELKENFKMLRNQQLRTLHSLNKISFSTQLSWFNVENIQVIILCIFHQDKRDEKHDQLCKHHTVSVSKH